MKVKIHSMVDVITNSSTVIYVQNHGKTIELAKALINDILKVAGNEKTADDLFEFKARANQENIKEKIDDNWEEFKDDLIKLGYTEEEINCSDKIKTDEMIEKLVLAYENSELEMPEYLCQSEGGFSQDELLIIPKDNSQLTIDLSQRVQSIFEIDGSWDG